MSSLVRTSVLDGPNLHFCNPARVRRCRGSAARCRAHGLSSPAVGQSEHPQVRESAGSDLTLDNHLSISSNAQVGHRDGCRMLPGVCTSQCGQRVGSFRARRVPPRTPGCLACLTGGFACASTRWQGAVATPSIASGSCQKKRAPVAQGAPVLSGGERSQVFHILVTEVRLLSEPHHYY
jgi:hypothetical protein